jgi:hypothetical protein
MGLPFTITVGPRQPSLFSGLNPAGSMTIFYCLRFETLQTCRGRSPYLYSPGTRWLSYNLRHGVPFSSPATTCSSRLHRTPGYTASGRT